MALRDLIISRPYPPGYVVSGERWPKAKRKRTKHPRAMANYDPRPHLISRLAGSVLDLYQVIDRLQRGEDPGGDCAKAVVSVIDGLRIAHALMTEMRKRQPSGGFQSPPRTLLK